MASPQSVNARAAESKRCNPLASSLRGDGTRAQRTLIATTPLRPIPAWHEPRESRTEGHGAAAPLGQLVLASPRSYGAGTRSKPNDPAIGSSRTSDSR